MTTSITERNALALAVLFSDESMTVQLDDGRSITVPITWFPRLVAGSPQERLRYEMIGGGIGIHWPLLDEDISVEGLLAGRRSSESAVSLARWLESRSHR
jgi:hypothetical protein